MNYWLFFNYYQKHLMITKINKYSALERCPWEQCYGRLLWPVRRLPSQVQPSFFSAGKTDCDPTWINPYFFYVSSNWRKPRSMDLPHKSSENWRSYISAWYKPLTIRAGLGLVLNKQKPLPDWLTGVWIGRNNDFNHLISKLSAKMAINFNRKFRHSRIGYQS